MVNSIIFDCLTLKDIVWKIDTDAIKTQFLKVLFL